MSQEAKDILAKCLKEKGCTNDHIHIGAFLACVDAMEIYARKKNQELIKEHSEWQSIREDDDEMGEPCDSDLYCSCGEEIENIGDTVCLDCFNEMTFND